MPLFVYIGQRGSIRLNHRVSFEGTQDEAIIPILATPTDLLCRRTDYIAVISGELLSSHFYRRR